MKKKPLVLLSLFVCAACACHATAQPTQDSLLIPLPLRLPETPAKIDTALREECRRILDEVEAMSLRCDTIVGDEWMRTVIYTDEQNRLRKYFRVDRGESERIAISAWYDNTGDIVYLTRDWYNCCEDSSSYFYLRSGRIVDFSFYFDCEACDGFIDKEHTIFRVGETPPAVGDVFTGIGDWFPRNLLHTDRLLPILRSPKYTGGEEWWFEPADR